MNRYPSDFDQRWLAPIARRPGSSDEHGGYDYQQFMLDVVDVFWAWAFAVGVMLLLLIFP